MTAMNDNLPLISIVIPSFNQRYYLREALESIFRQDYPHLEVVVMDGGSTDGSVEVIQSYTNQLKYWQSQADAGQSAAINAGMCHCNGDIVAWLNSDDYYWGDSLWTVGRAYAAFPGHGLYIGNGFRFNQREKRYSPFCRRHLALNRAALIHGLDYLLQPATFFLRSAWEEVEGLKQDLRFCMDWDVIIRIAARYPAVLINEFLAVSREYEETKTSSGKMDRAIEIVRTIQSHSQQHVTPGSLFYLLETLLDVTDDRTTPQLRYHFYEAMNAIRQQLALQYGNGDGFPEQGDSQDSVYLPFATGSCLRPARSSDDALPSISLITPSFNQAQFLGQTLESIFAQRYPRLETLVFDGGSNDGSVDVLRQYQDRLSYWVSEADRGPAHAINKGLARASGEVVGWLNSDDLLAEGALAEVGRAFAEDPELDMVFANALYIDEQNQLYPADHGEHRTSLYYGEMQPIQNMPAYWSYVYALPQPTVFFRRRLLARCGRLDESYHFIFDFELFWRFAWEAKIKKIERTQAFYRIHTASKTSDWNKFLVELYRFSRPWWPRLRTPEFRSTFRNYVKAYMRRRFGDRPRDVWFWGTAAVVGLSALTRVGNPEALRLRLPAPRPPAVTIAAESAGAETAATVDIASPAIPELRSPSYQISRDRVRYRSMVCSYIWPRHPGHSGGEIRDFHLMRRLLAVSDVEAFALYASPPDAREDLLAPYLIALHTPETIRATRPDLVNPDAFRRSLKTRVSSKLRSINLPVPGPQYHLDVASQFPNIMACSRAALQEALIRRPPDFLFVSPQTNPVALILQTDRLPTRLIMASYDVEAVRLHRFAATQHGLPKITMDLEARRAVRYEHRNLAIYDGVIAVSELDRGIFIRDYGFEPERVLVIENSVDPDYFAFNPRQTVEQPQIIFVGSLTYLPNRQAAWRLIRQIMPCVRQRYPGACLWIVGQSPDAELLAESDGTRVVVTGKIDDVRPYLAHASLACVPLISGSGTKYKVLEALSVGVPMICSPLAIEGLDIEDGKHVLLGQSDEELAAAIVRLLDEPHLAAAMAREGRELVERRYTWDANLARLDDWLDTIIALPWRKDKGQAGTLTRHGIDDKAAFRKNQAAIPYLNMITMEGSKHDD